MLDVVALGELLIDFAPVSTDAPGGTHPKYMFKRGGAWYNRSAAGMAAAGGGGEACRRKELRPMNVLFSSKEYDYHTLVKVAEMAGLAGLVGFHPAGEDYLLSFPDGEDTQALVDNYKLRLHDLENNIWCH